MKVTFLLAEEIRPEADAKLTILGLFANDTLIIEKPAADAPADTPRAIERLAILVTVSDDDESTHIFKGKILAPSGATYKEEMSFGEAKIPKGYSHTIIIEMKPFAVKETGIYRLKFFVDELNFEFPFEIRQRS